MGGRRQRSVKDRSASVVRLIVAYPVRPMRRTSRRPQSRRSQTCHPLQKALRLTRFGAVVAAALALASCAIMPSNSRYASKGDARPHEGVAPAHRLPIHGIDISKWQGPVDWASVKEAGTQFAFIKATEGGDHID